MTVDNARAAVITGAGVVARYPGLLCVARCSNRDVLLRLLDVCAGAAGPDPGRALARRLARWIGGPDAPVDDLEFGTVATAGDQLGVFLVGAVAVVVPGSPVALSGSDAAMWTDRLIPLPAAPVLLALDGVRPPAGLADEINDLRAGVVPGAGAVLFPVGRATAPRRDPAGVSGLDGPTIRTPAHSSAHIGVAHNGSARNGAPRNGVSSLLTNGSVPIGSDGDQAAEGAGSRRPEPRGEDVRPPNGYEWFADWSEHGGPPDAAPPDLEGSDAARSDAARSDAARSDAAGPDTAGPGPERWALSDAPADRPGPDSWTDTATPPGGSARGARPDGPAPVWMDPIDPEILDDPADLIHEGRHAILDAGGVEPVGGSDVPGSDVPGSDVPDSGLPDAEVAHGDSGDGTPYDVHPLADAPPAGAPPADAPAPEPAPVENHEPAAPFAVTARFDGADDATPVNAVAAVSPEPVTDGEADAAAGAGLDHGVDGMGDDVVPNPAPRPDRSPRPVPRPQDQTGPGEAVPDPDEPLLRGRLCEDGHLNDPRSSSCLACGAPVEESDDVVGPRPPLGRIVFDDGATFTVDAEYLVGRMPEADPRARSGELHPIVVEDRSGSVSRVHAEILINGWDVVLVDSGSRNGTFVAGPDEEGWTSLAPGRTTLLLPGTRVRMGGRTFVFEPPVAVG